MRQNPLHPNTKQSLLHSLPSQESLQILLAMLVVMLSYSIARFIFYLINIESFPISASELLLTMRTGLRFDLATFAYGSALGLPVLALGAGLSHRRFVREFALLSFFIPHSLALFANMADIAYFAHVSRRQTNELFTMPSEVLNASLSEAMQFWWLTLLSIAMLTVLFIALRAAFNFVANRSQPQSKSPLQLWMGRTLLVLGVFSGGIFLARGGTQDRPLRTGMAFTSDNTALGQLALNSAYSILWSRLHQNGQILDFMPPDTAQKITQDLIHNSQERFLDNQFPYLRQRPGNSAHSDTISWNVVIFIMESWNARQIGAIQTVNHNQNSYEATITPVFDSLASNGLLFTNFYASGDRSIHAFPAIIASLPNLTGSGILHTALETKRSRGLGSILKERDYKTIFAMGAEPSSMGFDSYAQASGFQIHYSEDSYPDSISELHSNQWGIFDGKFLGFVEERLSLTPEPFAMTFFSLTSHSPYEVPQDFANKYPINNDTDIDGSATPDVAAKRQQRSIRYADYALGQFFESARNSEYFDRTIFIITGDHTGWEEQTESYTPLEHFQVPLLIYAPKHPSLITGIDSLPANQVDILPTLLSLLGKEALSASMGQSLVEPHTHRISFSAKASVVHFLYDSLFIQATTDNILGAYDYRIDELLQNNLFNDSPVNTQVTQAITAFRAYLQTGLNSMINDKVYPSAPVLQELLHSSKRQGAKKWR